MPTTETTDPPAKAKPETWLDWSEGDPEPAAEELLTRDALLARLAAWHFDVTVSDLRYWEYTGVLPRAVRRWHEGAVRAVYPPWFPYVVRELRRLQWYEGHSLDEIRPRLRDYAKLARVWKGHALLPPPAEDGPHTPEQVTLRDELKRELERLALSWSRLAGVPAELVEVRVVGWRGRESTYRVPVDTEMAEESAALHYT